MLVLSISLDTMLPIDFPYIFNAQLLSILLSSFICALKNYFTQSYPQATNMTCGLLFLSFFYVCLFNNYNIDSIRQQEDKSFIVLF
jgi:hypothetical protein